MDYKEIYDKDYFKGKKSFFYTFGYGRFATRYFNNMYKRIAAYVNKISAGRVLDVGCAYGFMLQRFPENFQKFGIDVSEHAINIAKKRLPDAMFNIGGAEEKFPYEENFFDIVLFNDVLEHLASPKLALENIYRVLKKGGILYITTPNLNAVRKKLLKYADKKEHHISLFSHADLMRLLMSLGFKIEEHWTFINFFIYKRFKSDKGIESAFICRK